MTPRRWALMALGGAALAWVLGGEWVSISRGIHESHLLDAMVGLSCFGAGIVALDRRPGNAIGPLMVAFAATGFLANWGNLVPVFPTLGFVAGQFQAPLLVHIALAYPSGRLRTRFDRAVLGAFYAVAAAVGLVGALTFPRRGPGCGRCPWTPLFVPNRTVFTAVNWLSDRSALVMVPLFLAAIWLRWRRASQGERRELAPWWAAASILAMVYLLGAFTSSDSQDGFSYLLWELRSVLQISAPIVFVWGLLQTRLARSAVGDLVVALDRPLPPGGLQAALAQTLADPALQVAYALDREAGVEHPDGGRRWVDSGGQPVALPPPGGGRGARVATVVERNGRPLAALLHDPALDPGLVQAAGAAAGMAIENERLHAQVRAQLDEVRASRARIVQAGDEERLRIERNLHDGAQQRLLTLSLALHTARRQLGADADPALLEALRGASAELHLAIEELRELARGIHPAILTDEGLGPALGALAGRTSVPVALVEVPPGRLPRPVEAAAYFVVCEALTNVAKYADAASASVRVGIDDDQGSRRQAGGRTGLLVEVCDDGVGGADPARGSGLRGLQDRVAAVGGRLSVTSPPGHGTVVRAWLPCDADAAVRSR